MMPESLPMHSTPYLFFLLSFLGVGPFATTSQESSVAQVDLPVTFEDADVDYGLIDFDGTASMVVADPTDPDNTVARSTKLTGAGGSAGTTLSENRGGTPNDPGFATPIPFTSEETTISVRVWSPEAGTIVRLKVERSTDPTVSVETQTVTRVAMQWDTLSFDFSEEANGTAALNLASTYNKLTIFFAFGTSPTEDKTYYWDDIIFGGGGTGGSNTPMVAAPTPTRAADRVISMFSDAYDNVPVDTWRTDWSQGNLEDVEIAGNPTKKYTFVNFVGVETIANPIDLSAMTHLHVDYWTPDMQTFRVKLVDFAGDGAGMDGTPERANNTEDEEIFAPVLQEWNQLDIPLTDFDMNQTDINQFIISGLPVAAGSVFLDNVYFYNDAVSTNTPEVGVLEVYPNPVTDRVRITAPERMQELTLYSATGRQLARYQPDGDRFDLPTNELAPGVYLAIVRAGNRLLSVKLIK